MHRKSVGLCIASIQRRLRFNYRGNNNRCVEKTRESSSTKLSPQQGKSAYNLRVWSKCGSSFFLAIFQLRLGHQLKSNHKFELVLKDRSSAATLFLARSFYVASPKKVSSTRDMQLSTRLTQVSCAHSMQNEQTHYGDPARGGGGADNGLLRGKEGQGVLYFRRRSTRPHTLGTSNGTVMIIHNKGWFIRRAVVTVSVLHAV